MQPKQHLVLCLLLVAIFSCSTLAIAGENNKLPLLLDLGADRCVPCKMMAPILDKLEQDYAGRMDVKFIDVWKNKAEAQSYRVRVIPTQMFYGSDGEELFRHQGFYGREEILAKWQDLGYEFQE